MFLSRQIGLWRGLASWALCLAVMSGLSCRKGEPPARSPLDFVPSEADVLIVFDYKRLIEDEFLRRVFDPSEVQELLSKVGIRAEDIGAIAGFAMVDLTAMTGNAQGRPQGPPGDVGLIVQGKAGFEGVIQSLGESGWLRREHNGSEFYQAGEGSMAAAPVGRRFLVAGTPAGVRGVMDVASGKAPAATDVPGESESGAILRRIGTRGTINIAMSFPKEIKVAAKEVSQSAGIFGGMTGANMLRQFFDVLGLGRGVGVSFTGTEKGISTRVVFVTGNATSAKLVAGLLKAAKILIPTIDASGRMGDAVEIIRGLNVASENELVLIDFRIPMTILAEFR